MNQYGPWTAYDMRQLAPILTLIAVFAASDVSAAGPPDRSRLMGIYGEDDRRIIEDMGPPWSAIGRINRRTGGFCTAP
jgi:protease YdgD